ncbi:hypothetical protein CHLNCDRAFT_140767 [Chlorella variabilis]|uniref:C-factor n=1 Tax=Chlorella variabilis TaxID=554065 RepID=E1Z659_CHLVA|nr:hypothetical protein CHLNCDRAFT_140767 [Chlorella variabilis]EFN58591.1 hypothetical protein CHLNCDRAFT_140767 [Chlorella variabilis]|eukprot:XP_005850693.1 hypothetical protein CHLNCDRAFT_140767 [Chlorella variabilis]
MKLEGKTVVITGGNRGIGLQLVRQLLSRGNTVFATARQPSKADELQKLVDGSSGQLTVLQLDVASPESVEKWAAALKARTPHVDLLVNNSGVRDEWSGLEEVTAADMLHCFQTNAIGPLLVTQQLHKQRLLGSGSGGGSLMGSIDDNGSGSDYAYRASKAALNIVNKSLSIDLAGEGITCVLLHPGYVVTDMTGGRGLIDTKTCVAGLLKVLEKEEEAINGRWFDYKGQEVPW